MGIVRFIINKKDESLFEDFQKFLLTQSNISVEYNQNFGYNASVIGEIVNIYNEDFAKVTLKFYIYDEYDNHIGNAYAEIKNFKVNEKCFFEADMDTYSYTKPYNYELIDIIY